MEENNAFQFTEQVTTTADIQFKKQRAAYLAQRNARKKEAEAILKKDRGHSTSSDEDLPSLKKANPKFKAEPKKEDTVTNSSHDSGKKKKDKEFQAER